ncbi:GH92 family glycosyl hydrolase [Reichenbachiella carrageenanivorans]|uniref:GH92 family glycosyl hydrolase n=1 Tax=Reichenbachiella carrageenanivorans TaxID=2979869 RepID=A0ABY6D2H0_9BACT|nr:GH92 family glycosyl hydrolase [Reichenbachiella carrageenanivorans]UXX79815.1 GH92 family glycosyl hydrolase [Reichenbachiella carrageenanivorans]
MNNNKLYVRLFVCLILGLFASCIEKAITKDSFSSSTSVSDQVYPMLDTENSRWFFFSSASRPFGMTNLSPDTEIDGAWGSGYRYKTDTVKGFSHIHAWQMSGVSVMPVTISAANQKTIYEDFYSKFNHQTEKISPGYHYVELDRYQIKSELTSSTRVGFHQYTFPKGSNPAILFNLNTMLGPCENFDGELTKNTNRELSGKVVMKPTHRRPKPVTVFFKVTLSTDIVSIDQDKKTGNYLVNLTNPNHSEVLMKVGISYTSVENANHNLQEEIPHWDFEEVVFQSQKEWNGLLGRIKVEGGTETDRRRFYTDLWHALQGRRIISDANGAYPDNTGDEFRVGQLPLDDSGKPKFNHYNSDSFWGAQWTINTLWGLVYPEIKEEFVHSLLQYQKDGGLIPRGPSGGNYTYVMTGSSSTPFIVSAIQEGLITEDLESIYQALKKNHMVGGIMEKAGYEHSTSYGGGFKYYVENGYVPYPIPEGEFGGHQEGAGLTMEYAYQDWTLAQLAKKLGHRNDYNYFMKRSENFKNVYDQSTGWMRPKNVKGEWYENFDPYQHRVGFVEANSAQATWFVPHDLPGLATLMGGNEEAVEKLNKQFDEANKMGFTAGTSHDVEEHPEYRKIPINYGNQPSIQTAYIFNKLGRPDLTQYWARMVVEKTFSGLSPSTGYNGDEDQGLMGSLAVLMKMGLFQMNGGVDDDPVYQIGSPVFDKISITLNPEYYSNATFSIASIDNSEENLYVDSVMLNDQPLQGYEIRHSQITAGGKLTLQMSNNPKMSFEVEKAQIK